MSLLSTSEDDYKGYRWIKFDEDKLKAKGWDMAYNLESVFKSTYDRPYTPRLAPAIRLTTEGWPATGEDGKKILATHFDSIRSILTRLWFINIGGLRRYEVSTYTVCLNVSDEPSSKVQASSLRSAFDTFQSRTGVASPLCYAMLRAAGKPSKTDHQAYTKTYEGYGNWR